MTHISEDLEARAPPRHVDVGDRRDPRVGKRAGRLDEASVLGAERRDRNRERKRWKGGQRKHVRGEKRKTKESRDAHKPDPRYGTRNLVQISLAPPRKKVHRRVLLS